VEHSSRSVFKKGPGRELGGLWGLVLGHLAPAPHPQAPDIRGLVHGAIRTLTPMWGWGMVLGVERSKLICKWRIHWPRYVCRDAAGTPVYVCRYCHVAMITKG